MTRPWEMLGWQEKCRAVGTALPVGRGWSGEETARRLHRGSNVCLGLGNVSVMREEGQVEHRGGRTNGTMCQKTGGTKECFQGPGWIPGWV